MTYFFRSNAVDSANVLPAPERSRPKHKNGTPDPARPIKWVWCVIVGFLFE